MIIEEERYNKINEKRKREIIKKIRKTLSRDKKINRKIKAAIIFGSFLDNYFRDIDLALIGKLSFNELYSLESELSKATGFNVEIKAFEDLAKIPPLFRFSILKGKVIIERVPLKKYDFIKNYLDFLEFRRFMI